MLSLIGIMAALAVAVLIDWQFTQTATRESVEVARSRMSQRHT